jgi:hypothetical protein
LRFMMAARLAVWPFGYGYGGTARPFSERINHKSNTQSSSPAGLYEQWKFQPEEKKKEPRVGDVIVVVSILLLFVRFLLMQTLSWTFISFSFLNNWLHPSSLTASFRLWYC